MPGTVQAQADVGTLSLQGLGAFSSVLATLSADNVSPIAMIQLENLGAMFPTNGERAEKVKMLLQRCSDVRLNNLALVIGWRKNDSASLMANSAGGQAVSLLSLCLMNLFSVGYTGMILQRLCAAVSTSSARRSDIASVSQLADAASLLSGKLQTLGFGNFLAEQTVKIHSVYTALGKAAPENLLQENLGVESVVQLLALTSRALIEDNKICRISGSGGMGFILGLLLTLFPRSTMITVEGTIIQRVENAAIKIEILSVPENEPIKLCLESIISATSLTKLPVDLAMSLAYLHCHYRWSGWLADSLQNSFLNIGLECDQNIVDACCEFLMLIPGTIRVRGSNKSGKGGALITLLELLGPLPRARMYQTCVLTWRSRPRADVTDRQVALERLRDTVRIALRGKSCTCSRLKCDWRGWGEKVIIDWAPRCCPVKYVWDVIGSTLNNGLWAFFINAGANSVIDPGFLSRDNFCDIKQHMTNASVSDIVGAIMKLCHTIGGTYELAKSSDSCTIYPAIIETLSMPAVPSVAFNLVEGRIMFERRYHQRICSSSCFEREIAKRWSGSEIRPSHMGAHDDLPLLTLREGYDHLELRCMLRYAGNEIEIDLADAVKGFIGLNWLGKCSHNPNDCLDDRLGVESSQAISTSVAAPFGDGVNYGVAMTKGNPVAQFFCCSEKGICVLQKDCCLNCAAALLLELRKDQPDVTKGVIIVT